MSADTDVAGFCPMGCGATLFLAYGGHVTCRYLECPDPTVADTILNDPETRHIVTLDEATFTVRHPLRERVDDQLDTCHVHAQIASLGGPPRVPGRYRVHNAHHFDVASWTWEVLP